MIFHHICISKVRYLCTALLLFGCTSIKPMSQADIIDKLTTLNMLAEAKQLNLSGYTPTELNQLDNQIKIYMHDKRSVTVKELEFQVLTQKYLPAEIAKLKAKVTDEPRPKKPKTKQPTTITAATFNTVLAMFNAIFVFTRERSFLIRPSASSRASCLSLSVFVFDNIRSRND